MAEDLTLQALEDIGPDMVDVLKRFFRSLEDDGEKVDQALRGLGRLNGMRSHSLKQTATKIQAAKMFGIKGEALRPILQELLPESYASGEARKESQKALANGEPTDSGAKSKESGAAKSK